MRINNLSVVPLERFESLLRWAAAHINVASFDVTVVDLEKPGVVTGGLAFIHGMRVELHLSKGLSYPRLDRHPDRRVADVVGMVEFRSWDEEVVFVACHEFVHLRQFSAGKWLGDNYLDCEAEAETYALRALGAFRRECYWWPSLTGAADRPTIRPHYGSLENRAP
jgi:hypothetical protein